MVQEKYAVQLSSQEKGQLRRMVRPGRSSAQAITRARILLKIDAGWPFGKLRIHPGGRGSGHPGAHGVPGQAAICREGLDEVLHRRNQVNRYRKLDGRAEAHLIALACSPASGGQDHRTLRALAGKTVELGLAESLSHGRCGCA